MSAAESDRLGDPEWKRWGPYLAERAWGTVREDYSADGDAWNYFPFDHAVSRAYRWNEDGMAGLCDDQQRLCLAKTLVHDPPVLILDEPASGLDPRGRVSVLELVRDLAHNKGLGVVLSTHLLADVELLRHDGFDAIRIRRRDDGAFLGPEDAMRLGAAASAIQVTRHGTADAIPSRAEVDELLSRA